jgi:sugar O-acyltransferase (sialic acid O-acetyltransferase NeuD family)
MRDLVLIAGGGHGAVALDALHSAGMTVTGIVDPGLPAGQALFGVQIVGGDEWLDHADANAVLLVNGVGLGPGPGARRQIFEHWTARGFSFVRVRHERAIVSSYARLDEGSQIMAGAVVQCRAHIGRNVVVNTRASIDHDCVIGDHTFIAPGVVMCGGVSVGEDALIGAGAIVLNGLTIGRAAVIAAGAVVTRNVAAGAMVVGHRLNSD